MQPLGRAAEATALGDGDERAEQIELEHHSLIIKNDHCHYQSSLI
jgi:hypothetical protein